MTDLKPGWWQYMGPEDSPHAGKSWGMPEAPKSLPTPGGCEPPAPSPPDIPQTVGEAAIPSGETCVGLPQRFDSSGLPQTVWVAVVTVTSEVAVRGPSVTPLQSRSALFATSLATRTSAQVAAVAGTEAECREALTKWKDAHPGLQGEEVVQEVPYGAYGVQTALPLEKPSRQCADCGVDCGTALYCGGCQQKIWKSVRDNDPDFGKVEG